MEKSLDVARYILNKCTLENNPISNLQLQKIMYIIQRDFLQSFHRPVIDDSFSAWKYGPVIPNIYITYCGSGGDKIVRHYDINLTNISNEERVFIDGIIETRSFENPWKFVDETHKKGGAWDKIFRNGEGDGDIIPNSLIEELG